MKTFIIICLLTLFGVQPAQAAERIPVTLDRVIDGDTLSVKQNGHKKTVRLLLIDTPESKKPNTLSSLTVWRQQIIQSHSSHAVT